MSAGVAFITDSSETGFGNSEPPGGFVVEHRAAEDGRSISLLLGGELDLTGVPDLERAVRNACSEEPAEIVIDLGALTFLDSSGLRTILKSHQLCADQGREVSLRPGPPNVQTLFEITGLTEHLPFSPGEGDAGHP